MRKVTENEIAQEIGILRNSNVPKRMGKFGFMIENTGGGCTAYVRACGEVREMITIDDDSSHPDSLTDKVLIGTYVEEETEALRSGFTLAEVLAALENTSEEYFLLELRLENGFHIPERNKYSQMICRCRNSQNYQVEYCAECINNR